MDQGAPVLTGVQRAQHCGEVGPHRGGDAGPDDGRVVVGGLHGGVLPFAEQRVPRDRVRDESHGRGEGERSGGEAAHDARTQPSADHRCSL